MSDVNRNISGSDGRLGSKVVAAVLSRALADGFIGGSNESVVFFDLSRLDSILGRIKAAFPASALHSIAVKANPTMEILKRVLTAGHGAEVASSGELQLALAAGFPVEAIVFDSPVKTLKELELALSLGIGVNANTLNELERISRLYDALSSRSRVGIRINPQIGVGQIEATSVAVSNSKFGVPLGECRLALHRALSEYPWLTGLHTHIGSQGMSLQQLLDGIGAVYDFFVESSHTTPLDFFNIGGGLPAKYSEADDPIPFEEYAVAVEDRCPSLFTPAVSLVTEFGRSIHAGCGWVASKVEYVIRHGEGVPTLLIHVGADMFLRKAYHPNDWHHDISVCDRTGRLRVGPRKVFSVAGPLCFAGDYLDRSVSLPEDICEGDYVIIHDAGAYTFSMWSLYNSRQFPAIVGYEELGERFRYLRHRQSVEDIVGFWSCQ